MNTFPKMQQQDLLAADGARAYALAHAVKSVRLALASESDTDLSGTDVQKEEHVHQPNGWAVKACEIKSYSKWTDEDALMYECVALASWENQ